ncbi:MAG: methyltransferase domain-containing protein [Bryobacteraceae bacterium]
MSPDPTTVTDQMRADWNHRAKEDAHYYVAFGAREQDEVAFQATADEAVRAIESELKHFSADTHAMQALEIGCGPGRLLKPLSRHFARIYGVDVSDEMIRLAHERIKEIPNAHVEATNGATLSQFADESLDFIYSYAVFQHIPSRDVVLSYMREAQRVLKTGGIFRAQFNGLPHDEMPDTWSGVTFSAEDLKAFTRENNFRLLALEGVDTQYLWTTWQRKPLPLIRRITNAHTSETLVPAYGRHAVASIWIVDLPHDIDLNNLEVLFDGNPGTPYYIGPPQPGNLRQINVRLPRGLRTGLLPVELCGAKKWIRVVPPGPLVPRIVSVTDGINIVQHNRITTGYVKVVVEEISDPSTISVTIDSSPGKGLECKCTDPVPPRYELNFTLPDNLAPGPHTLRVTPVKSPVTIETQN